VISNMFSRSLAADSVEKTTTSAESTMTDKREPVTSFINAGVPDGVCGSNIIASIPRGISASVFCYAWLAMGEDAPYLLNRW
jgi:hypothetical protein